MEYRAAGYERAGSSYSPARVTRRIDPGGSREIALAHLHAFVALALRIPRAIFHLRCAEDVGRVLVLHAGQLGKVVTRGLLAVVLLGLAFGIGLGVVTDGPGGLLGGFIEGDLLPALIADAIPLALAVFFSARTGGSLAAKFAHASSRPGADDPIQPEYLLWTASPHLVAAVIAGALFFFLTAELLVVGYLAGGSVSNVSLGLPPYLAGWADAAVPGVLKSMLFAYLVSHIAIAYGTASGQLAARSGTEDELHYVIWRSFRATVLICALVTVVAS